jgi:hypothetical protein
MIMMQIALNSFMSSVDRLIFSAFDITLTTGVAQKKSISENRSVYVFVNNMLRSIIFSN